MRPEFIINDRGAVFCKSHPKYQIFSEYIKELHNIQEPHLKTAIDEVYNILYKKIALRYYPSRHF